MSYNAEFEWKKPEERAYLFDHVWQQVVDKFYDPTIHNIDWAFYKRICPLPALYQQQLRLCRNVGRITGRTECFPYRCQLQRRRQFFTDGSPGCFYDETFDGDGLKIKEILEKGPLDLTSGKIKPGMIIRKINNQEIKRTGLFPDTGRPER